MTEPKLAIHQFGSRDSTNSSLLLIHGFPFDYTMWQPQIEVLSQDFHLIVPDLRGFGASASAEGDATHGVDMATYAEDLVAVLDCLQLDEPVILCGFSMGGYILWQLAKRIPQRVKALVLCDTRAAADSSAAIAGRLQMAERVIETGTEPIVEGMLPKLLAADTLASRPQIVEQVAAMIRRADPAAIAAAQRGMARRCDMQAELASFTWPALVLAGAEDAISSPEEMRGIAESLPSGRFCQIEQAGHMSPLENPAAVNQVIADFAGSL